MSEARALTNLIGNGVATVAVSKWEKELDYKKMQEMLESGGAKEELATVQLMKKII